MARALLQYLPRAWGQIPFLPITPPDSTKEWESLQLVQVWMCKHPMVRETRCWAHPPLLGSSSCLLRTCSWHRGGQPHSGLMTELNTLFHPSTLALLLLKTAHLPFTEQERLLVLSKCLSSRLEKIILKGRGHWCRQPILYIIPAGGKARSSHIAPHPGTGDRYFKIKTMAGARRSRVLPGLKKRLHISHSWDQEDLPNYTCAQWFLRYQRREAAPDHNTFCQLPKDPCARIYHGWKMNAHTWEGPESDQIWIQTKRNDWPEETQSCPHINNLNYPKMHDSFPEPVCISTCTFSS